MPTVESHRLGMLGDVGCVPVLLLTSEEQPFAVDAPIVVEVTDRHHDPPVTHLVLGAAVDGTGGSLAAVELDPMTDDLMDGSAKRPQRWFDPGAQRVASESVAADLDVRHEQCHPR